MLPLSIKDLSVTYPGLDAPALRIDDLTVVPGSRLAITGPSGSGKTTFVNIITGLEAIRAGSVRWGETDLSGLSESGRDRWRARNIGLVMQDFHLFPGLSALDNVLLPQRLAHFRLDPALPQRATELLARVGIERPRQSIETMSRGQMQRVAVARALLARPGVLIADEPTASLDEDNGAAVADLLLELAREEQATLIVVSHDARLVERMDNVLRLVSGHPVTDRRELAA